MYLNIMGYYSDSACNKMYSREIFDSINFPLNKKYEDTRIMYKIFDKLDYVFYDSDIKYYYRKREGSIVTNQATMFELIDSINDEKLYLNKYPSLEKYINQHLIIAYMSIYNNIDNSKLKFNTHKNAIYLKKQFTYKYLTLSKKIQVFLFINFVSLYNFIYKIIKK